LSLHNILTENYVLITFSNTLTTLANYVFFFHIFFALVLSFNENYSLTSRAASLVKLYFLTVVLIAILFFSIKFYLVALSQLNLYSTGVLLSGSYFSEVLILLALVITIVSWVYLSERYLYKNIFFLFYFFIFVVTTINMVYATNLLVMFIFFEFIFLPSLFFVYQFGYAKKVEKTIGFLLLWTLTGSFIALFGILYIYGTLGSLEVADVTGASFTAAERNFLFLLFFIGFGIKIPLWPFHYWLTKVHVEAPTGFSIFLSGFLVKTAFFCFAYFYTLFVTPMLALVAASVISWGFVDASIRMWSSTDIKRLIAFATIQEMNLIVIFLVLLGSTNWLFLNLFLFVHGVLSALLFYLVDNVQKRSQTRNLVTLSGFSFFMPKLHYIVWVAILIFRGFPFFIKFFIEWELLSILYVNWGLVGCILFAVVAVFGVLGFCRIWFSILYGQPSENLEQSGDMLKKDWVLGVFLISILFFVTQFMFLFKWLVF
jgi:NADH-quinone oxidoreductase subunit M